MIVFIDLRATNLPISQRFAFWDMSRNEFMTVDHEQAWATEQDFKAAVRAEHGPNPSFSVERYTSLMPTWVRGISNG